MADLEKRALTVSELIGVLQAAVAADPVVGDRLVMSTTEAGYVHEYISGIDKTDATDGTLLVVILGEP